MYWFILLLVQVQLKDIPNQTFAIKCLSKKHIVETDQQDHIFSEKDIMMKARCPFIARSAALRTFIIRPVLY